MIINKKVIFIHIMKNAGASIETFLNWKVENRHFSNREYIDCLGKKYNKYFTFSTIRNPWDRMVSIYFFGKQKNKRWAKKFKNFNNWVKFIVNNNYKKRKIYWNQFDWLKNYDNEINLDFLLRFERLNKDWKLFCKKVGMIQKKLPFVNQTKTRKKKDYRLYYNDESIELVAKKYKKDIETFNYTFRGQQ